MNMGFGDGFKFGLGFFVAGILISAVPGIIAFMAFASMLAASGAGQALTK